MHHKRAEAPAGCAETRSSQAPRARIFDANEACAKRVACGALVVFACFSFSCRKLTAEPIRTEKRLDPVERRLDIKVAETIYDAGLKPGWQDYGWGKHDLSSGPARIDLSSYGGWILHHDEISTRFGALMFQMLAPGSLGTFLEVRVANGDKDESNPGLTIGPEYTSALPGGWVQVYVPLRLLNPSNAPFDRIMLHASAPVGSDWVKFDKVIFTTFVEDIVARDAAATPVTLSVNCKAPGHSISPYIYGVAGAGDPWELGATARRWGGNPTTRYNWQLGTALNVGKDWFFENGTAGDYREFLAQNRQHQAATALTVPMIGWVAKDTTSSGFPISVYGPQTEHDQYRPDAGNGVKPDGTEIKPRSPTQTSVPAPPEMMQKWVATIRQQDQKDGARAVKMYILDNEPNLWSANHRDVHPDPLTYDELLDRTIKYGTAIRTADPGALIAGPAEWGWMGYFYSAKDAASGTTLRPDRRAHGDVALVPWYLKKLKEHDVPGAPRILDVLDVHFYPQGAKVFGDAADAETAALRLRSTRALWDPSYKDESWIKDYIRLIPRLKEWIAQNYPGLAISIGEYNFGGEKHISGALALAEALGRFGNEGVDYAYYWTFPAKNTPAYWAFRAYRNFDGNGGQFLGRSVETKMAPNVSLFASRDEAGKHWVLIALNLDPNKTLKAHIGMDGCDPIATRRAFKLDANEQSIKDEGSKPVSALDEILTPYSINVFDIMLK